jgi:hypothetical protein
MMPKGLTIAAILAQDTTGARTEPASNRLQGCKAQGALLKLGPIPDYLKEIQLKVTQQQFIVAFLFQAL